MTLPTSLLAYRDCKDLFEAAVADPAGARLCTVTYDAAVHMRMRMNYFRKLDRAANAKTYPADHPLHGASSYDEFHCTIKDDTDGEYWLYCQRRTHSMGTIQPLSEVEEVEDDKSTSS